MDARMDEAPALFRLDGFPSSLETNALPPGSNPVTLTRPVQGGPGAFCPQIYLGGGGISCHPLQHPAHGSQNQHHLRALLPDSRNSPTILPEIRLSTPLQSCL